MFYLIGMSQQSLGSESKTPRSKSLAVTDGVSMRHANGRRKLPLSEQILAAFWPIL